MKIGIISGYFNPIHAGHIAYIEASKSKCDYLVCIVNNDHQVDLKGSKKFMDETHRCKIMKSLRDIDEVVLSIDTDKTVCKTITMIRTGMKDHKFLFFNSGDRVGDNIESEEVILCKKLEIKYVAISLPKVYSSSKLLNNI